MKVFIVGNKCDLEDQIVVDDNRACTFAASIHAEFRKTSTVTGFGINDLFHDIGSALLKEDNTQLNDNPILIPAETKNKKGCCK